MTEPCYRYGLYGGLYTYNGREWVDILRFDIWTQFLNLGVLVLVERLRTYVRTYGASCVLEYLHPKLFSTFSDARYRTGWVYEKTRLDREEVVP
jgi:hypothetical protein